VHSLKQHNFGAGPCILPFEVIQEAANAVQDWNRMGLSILEISHRSEEFLQVIEEAEALVRELLKVPANYSVLFLQGGASSQFAMVPMSFLQGTHKKAAFLDTGYFSQKAIKEAKYFGEVKVISSAADRNYNHVPDFYEIPDDAAYLHLTSNNTIEGTQLHSLPKTAVPIVCDMSSDIFSKTIDVSKFALIYAGAQKNMGPAGMTLVIVKNDFLDQVKHPLPSMWDYRIHRESKSLFNTAPVYAIYVAMLNLRWLKAQGGVAAIEELNNRKSALLYDAIAESGMFMPMADERSRSKMNVTFKAVNEEIEQAFLAYATSLGIVGIAGFPSRGGFRVSLYNALPLSSVAYLIKTMQYFKVMNSMEQNVDILQHA
jgi:phosphoserine aminotransferase